jgi:hypothetical protein
MTRADILMLNPGDSVIGFANRWTDELPVVDVGDLEHKANGRVLRPITVRCDRITLRGTVYEGDSTIRGARI